MLEKLNNEMKIFFNFNQSYFFNSMDGYTNCKTVKYCRETLGQFLYINGDLADPNDEITIKNFNWAACNYISRYLKNPEGLTNDYLNNLALIVFCAPKEARTNRYWNPFNKSSIKELMRVVEVSNEFYFENIGVLKEYYHILKRKNKNLKEDSAKLITTIERETINFKDKAKKSYNLSSKKIFELPVEFFATDHWRFNWPAIKEKYFKEMKEIITEGFKNETFFNLNSSINYIDNLFYDFIVEGTNSDDPFALETYLKISAMRSLSTSMEDIFLFLYRALSFSCLKSHFNINDNILNTLFKNVEKILFDKFQLKISVELVEKLFNRLKTLYYFSTIQNMIRNDNRQQVSQENFEYFLKRIIG